jgi:large subunit ribosomal protein L7/L12
METVETPAKFKSIVESIEKMSVLDLNELVKLLEKKFGVSAAAVAVAAPVAAAGAGEEKSTVALHLTASGDQKIAVIKVIKEALALGLKEAKDMVDGAPILVKDAMKKEDADVLKKKIEDAGGKVEYK